MKKIIFFLLAALALASCKVDDIYYGTYPEDEVISTNINWYEAADSSTRMALIDKFFVWDDEALWINNRWCSGFFNARSTKDDTSNNNYWGQAHAIDNVTEAYVRSGDPYYADVMERWYNGVRRYQYGANENNPHGYANNGWYNPYIDDMEWIVLSLIKMYEATGIQKYFDDAKYTYDSWIITTWDYDENGGGLLWSHSAEVKSKNACSNGPGAIIAAKLYNITQDEKYLDDAIMIYNWLKAVLWEPTTGAVNDAISGGNTIGTYKSTYNQGTFLGAAHELYKITGRESYLREAIKTGNWCIENLVDATGKLFQAEGDGDWGFFRGIFIRYFTQLTNETAVDKTTRRKFHDFLLYNAIVQWTEGIIKDDPEGYGMFYTGDIQTPGYFKSDHYSVATSGAALIEAMNILKPVE